MQIYPLTYAYTCKPTDQVLTRNKMLRTALNNLHNRCQKPLFIVENGMGAIDELTEDGKVHDDYRIYYLQRHLSAMRDAVDIDGVDLMGYAMWGCTDLVSAGTGELRKRYGFICVDMDDEGKGTGKRVKKTASRGTRR